MVAMSDLKKPRPSVDIGRLIHAFGHTMQPQDYRASTDPFAGVSEKQYRIVCVLVTLISTGAFVAAIAPDAWDFTSYDEERLAKAFQDNDTGKPCQGFSSNRFKLERESLVAVVRDVELGNATLLADEAGGVWRICRRFPEEPKLRDLLRTTCRADPCRSTEKKEDSVEAAVRMQVASQASSWCCNGTCPYSATAHDELGEGGDGSTLYEVVSTQRSTVVVAIILSFVTYANMAVGLGFHYVTMVRMSGVTCLLSGLFLTFSLIANHYKILIMNTEGRGFSYLPCQIAAAQPPIRHTQIGWAMFVGWGAVGLHVLAALTWIMYSRFLVHQAYKSQLPVPKPSKTRPTTTKSRVKSAANGRRPSVSPANYFSTK